MSCILSIQRWYTVQCCQRGNWTIGWLFRELWLWSLHWKQSQYCSDTAHDAACCNACLEANKGGSAFTKLVRRLLVFDSCLPGQTCCETNWYQELTKPAEDHPATQCDPSYWSAHDRLCGWCLQNRAQYPNPFPHYWRRQCRRWRRDYARQQSCCWSQYPTSRQEYAFPTSIPWYNELLGGRTNLIQENTPSLVSSRFFMESSSSSEQDQPQLFQVQ